MGEHRTCPECDGSGTVWTGVESPWGDREYAPCHECDPYGRAKRRERRVAELEQAIRDHRDAYLRCCEEIGSDVACPCCSGAADERLWAVLGEETR